MNIKLRLSAIPVFTILVVLVLSGCGILTRKPATQAPPESYTQAAETIVVQLTQAASSTEMAPEAAPQMPTPTAASLATEPPAPTEVPTEAPPEATAIPPTATPLTPTEVPPTQPAAQPGVLPTAIPLGGQAGASPTPLPPQPTVAQPPVLPTAPGQAPGAFPTAIPLWQTQPLVVPTTAPVAVPTPFLAPGYVVGSASVTATVTVTGQPTAVSPAAYFAPVYLDDFSSNLSWDTKERAGYTLRFYNGGYRMINGFREDILWSYKKQIFGDVRVEVEASRLGGPIDGYYGPICRFYDGEINKNYYAFVVSGNGHYAILKKYNGKIYALAQSTTPSSLVTGATVLITADCVGEDLTLYVNKQPLLTVQDFEIPSGYVGMAVGTHKESGMDVVFDNLAILAP